MIDNNINQKERLEKLNQSTIKELEFLINNKNIVGLEKFDNKIKSLGGKIKDE